MNDLTAIPCMLFRGGTSKGAYFLASDLPTDRDIRNSLIRRILGSPDASQIDGLGGGSFVTSKVAILNQSERDGIDVDYKFIQVTPESGDVDDKPTCGNLLSAVGVFALETQLVPIENDITEIRIYDVNTGATVIERIQTPNRKISYKGDFAIAGVPGTAAPVDLYFSNIAGGKTGHYLPTGNLVDVFDGVSVSCLDISMPTVFIHAESMGVDAHLPPKELDADSAFMQRLETIRESASQAMGLGSAKGNVIPKIALISPPQRDADINIRYFTPLSCHPAVAVSAGFCVSAGCFIQGTIMNQIHNATMQEGDCVVKIENPSGITPISVCFPNQRIDQVQGSARRTARLIFKGEVFV